MAMDTAGRITITQPAPLASQTRSWERSMRTSDVMLAPHDAENFRQYRGKRRNASSHLLPEKKKIQVRRSATRPMFRPTYICINLRAYGRSAVPFSQTRWFILDVPLTPKWIRSSLRTIQYHPTSWTNSKQRFSGTGLDDGRELLNPDNRNVLIQTIYG